MTKKIEDFGEKIGGARKDMFHKGMNIEDLVDTTDAEKLKFITRNNLFPEVDYQKLYEEENIPKEVLMFRKNMRSALPVDLLKGNYKDRFNVTDSSEVQKYIDFIGDMQDKLNTVKTMKDVEEFYSQNIRDVYGSVRGRYFYGNETGKYFVTNKVLKAAQRTSLVQLKSDVERKNFLVPKEKSITKNFDILPQQDGKFLVADKKTAAIIAVCKTMEDVEKVCQSAEKKKTRRKDFVPPQLENIERSGVKYQRFSFVTGQDYLDTFQFKGGEFGNWMTQNDREVSLRYGYDALLDLSKALNIAPENISLGGSLSIAFGSRGRKGALAHYEPLRNVINLTKMKGAGSLAHEWGHALDNFLGSKYSSGTGTFLSDRVHDMPQMLNLWKAMMRSGDGGSDYYESSVCFDKMFHPSKAYWSSTVEMFARAFSCYVQDKLQEQGIRSDYLCGHSDLHKAYNPKSGNIIYAFPRGEERERINQAFDELIKQIQKDGYFQEYEPAKFEYQEKEILCESTESIYSSCSLPEDSRGQPMLFDYEDLENEK